MGRIYLDNCATTKVDRDVAEVAVRAMEEAFGNPSSLHAMGIEAENRLETAREQLARGLHCAPKEVVFTGGGTEANNLALLGGAQALHRRGRHIVAMRFEHASVLEPLRHLEKMGFELTLADPEPDGSVNAAKLLNAVREDTILVSCMLVNSEVGTIAPIAEIGRGLREKNKLALFHCDGVQGFGKLPVSVAALGVDLLSVSGHKLHAPKGVGALYVRGGARILPVLHGGGQERGLRPGTENVPAVCAFGYAAEKATNRQNLEANLNHVRGIHEYFVNKAETLPKIRMNSHPSGTPYLCNLSAPGYRSETLLHYLAQREIYVSSGSACSRGARSHVLTAMGLPDDVVDGALRVSFSRDTAKEEIDRFFQTLEEGLRDVAHR